MFGISKRGAAILRTLVIHGARSALRCAEGKQDRMLHWALKLKEAKGFNVAAVALANKMVRVTWALLAHGRRYEVQWNDHGKSWPAICADRDLSFNTSTAKTRPECKGEERTMPNR